jgi:hypothetical protein
MWLRLRWLLLLLMLLRWWRSGGEGGGSSLLVVVMLLLVVLVMLRMRMRMLRRVLTWWRQRIGRGLVVGRMRVHGSGCTELWLQGETAGTAGRAQNHVMLHLKMMASHLKDSLGQSRAETGLPTSRRPLKSSLGKVSGSSSHTEVALESDEASAEVKLSRSSSRDIDRTSHQSTCCYVQAWHF